MKPWLQTDACASRAHCAACLAGNWHKLDACPHGVTAANLPTPKPPPAIAAVVRGPCQHRGPDADAPAKCPTCTGNVMVKVFWCDQHYLCTVARKIENLACCATCSDHKELTS